MEIAPQASTYLFRLAYEVNVAGRPAMARSYLGFDVLNQEPMLGEKDGLIGSHSGTGPGYGWVAADFMQDGSLGHKITIEARVYSDGVAFRYVLPWSAPLANLLICDEATEFHFAAGPAALQGLPETGAVALPYRAELPGGWIEVMETREDGYPAASLAKLNADTVVTRLARIPGDPELAYKGHAPFTGPWRVIVFGNEGTKPAAPAWVRDLPAK